MTSLDPSSDLNCDDHEREQFLAFLERTRTDLIQWARFAGVTPALGDPGSILGEMAAIIDRAFAATIPEPEIGAFAVVDRTDPGIPDHQRRQFNQRQADGWRPANCYGGPAIAWETMHGLGKVTVLVPEGVHDA